MQYLRQMGWDFIVGQSSKNCYRSYPNGDWQTFGETEFVRCLFVDNWSFGGAALNCQGDTSLIDCTLVGNYHAASVWNAQTR